MTLIREVKKVPVSAALAALFPAPVLTRSLTPSQLRHGPLLLGLCFYVSYPISLPLPIVDSDFSIAVELPPNLAASQVGTLRFAVLPPDTFGTAFRFDKNVRCQMYHPSRGGVRGGRDQFSWDDVKVDKHRENYLGHSIKAPVGRWQKGKDLHWYTRDKGSGGPESDALKEEIKRIKEEEEQAMREALGLAPKRSNRPQANRLDKHELSELVKRGSTAEDLGAGHSEAAFVHGLGFSRTPRPWEDPSTLSSSQKEGSPELVKEPMSMPATNNAVENVLKDDISRNKRRHEERGQDKHEKREERKQDKHEKRGKHEKRQSRDLGDKRKHKKDKERRRHDSDSD